MFYGECVFGPRLTLKLSLRVWLSYQGRHLEQGGNCEFHEKFIEKFPLRIQLLYNFVELTFQVISQIKK